MKKKKGEERKKLSAMLLDLEKLSVWCSLRRRDDACSSSDSDPVGIRPCSRQAQGSSIWERGGLGAGRSPSSCPGLQSSQEQLSG